MDKFSIEPAEAILLGWDFSAELSDGETLVDSNQYGSTTAKLFDSSGADVTDTNLEQESIGYVTSIVQARVHSTVKGSTYSLKFYAATSIDNYRVSTLTIKS